MTYFTIIYYKRVNRVISDRMKKQIMTEIQFKNTIVIKSDDRSDGRVSGQSRVSIGSDPFVALNRFVQQSQRRPRIRLD